MLIYTVMLGHTPTITPEAPLARHVTVVLTLKETQIPAPCVREVAIHRPANQSALTVKQASTPTLLEAPLVSRVEQVLTTTWPVGPLAWTVKQASM